MLAIMRFFEKNNLNKQNRCFDKSIKINDFNINYKFKSFIKKKKLKIVMIARSSKNQSL